MISLSSLRLCAAAAVLQTLLVQAAEIDSTTFFTSTARTTQTSKSTVYVVSLTYTAPSSCSTHFTFETAKTLYRPPDATITPTSTATGLYDVTAYLPSAATSAAATDYIYKYFIEDCINPAGASLPYYGGGGSSGSGSGSSSSSSEPDVEVCVRRTLCMRWRTFIIFIATVLPSLFVLGFLESFFWFRRLMLGRSALRFGTLCWTLMSAWVLCFTRRSPERPREDWKALRAQWKAMGAKTKWKLWWKWGFRHKYPVELLGPDPRYPIARTLEDQSSAPEAAAPAGEK